MRGVVPQKTSSGVDYADSDRPGHRRRQGQFMRDPFQVICNYCGLSATLVDGTVIYPHRRDVAAKKYWHCSPCDAYVGTTKKARGMPRWGGSPMLS